MATVIYEVIPEGSDLKIALELPSKFFAELDDEQKSAIKNIVDIALKKTALVLAASISVFPQNKTAGNAMLNNISDHLSTAIMENQRMLFFVKMGISTRQFQSPTDASETMFS